jgi:polyprenyldihydroxybenzoate methyltransferase/3-demethylubiquinol 3-O-methyltransferase
MSNILTIKENIYGHFKRLEWLISHLKQNESIVEFGCGTGYMITLQLAKMGYSISGIDSDKESIAYGRKIFDREGLDPDTLQTTNLAELDFTADVIIASEVLEHIPNVDLGGVFASLSSKLKPGGLLLITVPNGYGWFELESFLWFKAGLGRIIAFLRIDVFIKKLKRYILGIDLEDMTPSSLANSPHVQRFTYDTIQRLLNKYGFTVTNITGSVLFCGPFSNLMFTGIATLMRINAFLGSKIPKAASAFYVAARKRNGQN